MKIFEVLSLKKGLNDTNFDNVSNGKFQYALVKNIKMLDKEVETINEASEKCKSNVLVDLINEIRPLIDKEIKSRNNISNEEAIVIETEILTNWEKYSEWNVNIELYNKAIFELQNSESEFIPFQIDLSLIETLNLTNTQMKVIYPLIKE